MACGQGDPGTDCLRNVIGQNGLCPVADLAPELDPDNDIIVSIYTQSQGSGNQVAAEDKTYVYLLPSEVEALMRVHNVPQTNMAKVLRGVLHLQDQANRLRMVRPKKSRKIR